jgi:hypothetical protein
MKFTFVLIAWRWSHARAARTVGCSGPMAAAWNGSDTWTRTTCKRCMNALLHVRYSYATTGSHCYAEVPA